MELPKIVAIVGPNASGKSSMGVELAKYFCGEIISADSRQLYRGFDLCCGKITESEMQGIPHYLLSVKNIGDQFSAFDFQREAYTIIPQILNRGNLPFIVGGSVAYVIALTEGYLFDSENKEDTFDNNFCCGDMESLPKEKLQAFLESNLSDNELQYAKRNNSDWNNPRRLTRYVKKSMRGISIIPQRDLRYNALMLGVTWPQHLLYKRIDERLDIRIRQGMLDEVRTYLDGGGCPQYLYNLGLEYRFILEYLTGKYSSQQEFRLKLSTAIKQYAKRQIKFLKAYRQIQWIDMTSDYIVQAKSHINSFLRS